MYVYIYIYMYMYYIYMYMYSHTHIAIYIYIYMLYTYIGLLEGRAGAAGRQRHGPARGGKAGGAQKPPEQRSLL